MSISFTPLFEPTVLTGTTTKLFTAQLVTRIDKLTVANSLDTTASLSIFIVMQGGVPNQGAQVLPPRPIQPNEAWDVEPMIGHVLNIGDALWALSSTANQLVLFGSGTLLSG